MLHLLFGHLQESFSTTFTIAVVGALIAGGAATWGRTTTSTGALVLSVLVGAFLSVSLFGSGWIGLPHSCKEKLEQAIQESKNVQIEHDLQAARVVAQKQEEIIAKQKEQLDEDQKLIDKVNEAIRKHPKANADCPTAAFSDELRAIGRIR